MKKTTIAVAVMLFTLSGCKCKTPEEEAHEQFQKEMRDYKEKEDKKRREIDSLIRLIRDNK